MVSILNEKIIKEEVDILENFLNNGGDVICYKNRGRWYYFTRETAVYKLNDNLEKLEDIRIEKEREERIRNEFISHKDFFKWIYLGIMQ